MRPLPAALRFSVYVFFSGACALVYQTVWQRELRLIFGGSTAASGAVLAAFIFGLGAGSLVLARRVERSPRPFALYARLELGIAVASALTPLLFQIVRAAYVAVGGTQTLGSAGGTAARVVLTGLVILVPTFLMGGTLPAVARAVTSDDDTQRGGVALLYGLNTLGAVTGAAIATFNLLPRLGNRNTLLVGCAVNLTVAAAAWLRSRNLPDVPSTPSGAPAAEAEGDQRPPPRAVVLGAAFAVGAVFFLMELVWYRMLAPLLGGSVFTFGLVLCVALAGIGLGGAAYGVLARRGAATLATFALTCLLEALAVALPLAIGDRLALVAAVLQPLVGMGFGSAVGTWAAITLGVVFPAAFVSGVQFPILIAMAGKARAQVADHVAQVYAANTSGSVLGALAGGFGLLPWLGAPGAWRLAAGALLVVGLVAASASGATRSARRGGLTLLLAGLTVLCLMALGPTAVWRHSAIGAGRMSASLLEDRATTEQWIRNQRRDFLWQQDGVEAGVGLLSSDSMAFLVNGKSDGTATQDSATQVMSGLLGTLLHPGSTRVLVIGLGSGSTAGWVAQAPGIERVDVMELEPVMLDVARTMKDVNRDVLNNPKVHISIGDARELLALSDGRYDVVFSEPSNPYRVGVANLYTREYYQQVLAHLKPGGLFIQWCQAYEVDGETVVTVYATLKSVFQRVETWYGAQADLLLVASNEPVVHDVAALRTAIAAPPYAQAQSATWFSQSIEGFFSHYLAGPDFTDWLVQHSHSKLNTDDLNRIEFGLARTLGIRSDLSIELYQMINAFDPNGTRFPKELDPNLLRFERWLARAEPQRHRLQPPPDDWPAPERGLAETIRAMGDGNLKAAALAFPADYRPRTPSERLARLGALAMGRPPEFQAEADLLRPTFPIEVELLEAAWAREGHDLEGELQHLERSFALYRENPWVQTGLIELAVAYSGATQNDKPRAKRLMAALAKPFAARSLNTTRLIAYVRLAEQVGDSEACAQTYEAMLPNIPWEREHLTRSLECFKARRPALVAEAEADLIRAIKMAPRTLRLQFDATGLALGRQPAVDPMAPDAGTAPRP